MAIARFSLPRRGFYAPAMMPRVALADLLAGQFFPQHFRRYDLLVRARVVRAWLSDSSDVPAAESSYEAMQTARGAAANLPRFKALVESVSSDGMNPDYPVGLSPAGPLLDGAHRVAVALATSEPTIAVDVRPSAIPPDYSRAWLAAAGFAEADLLAADILLDKFLATTGHDFLAVVAGEVTGHQMSAFTPGAEVVTTREVSLDQETVASLERALTTLPWPDHAKRAFVPSPVLGPGVHTVIRLRLRRPQWNRIPGTHTRTSGLASVYQENLARGGAVGLVSQTWSHSREGFAILAHAGVGVWGVSGVE